MAEIETDSSIDVRSERVILNYDARIRLQTKSFKQNFHHKLSIDIWVVGYIRKTENTAQGEP